MLENGPRTAYLDEIVRSQWEIQRQREHIRQLKKLLKKDFGMSAREVNEEIAGVEQTE